MLEPKQTREYEEESVRRGLEEAMDLLMKHGPAMWKDTDLEPEGALVGKRKNKKSPMQIVEEAIEKLDAMPAEEFNQTLLNAGAIPSEGEVTAVIEEMFKDGKSPMQYFGTSWEQMEELEGKLEQYKAMEELQHISQEWDMYVDNAVVMKNIK